MSSRLLWAIKETIDAYQGGQQKLADLMGVNYNSFRNKANPNKSDEKAVHLTVPELIKLMQVTGDFRVLMVLADEFGFDLPRKPDQVSSPEDAVFHQLYCMQRGSDKSQDVRQWLARQDIRRADFLGVVIGLDRRLMTLAELAHG